MPSVGSCIRDQGSREGLLHCDSQAIQESTADGKSERGKRSARRLLCCAARRWALVVAPLLLQGTSLLSATVVSRSHYHMLDQQRSAVSLLTGRALCHLEAPMSSGSSSSWWVGWSGTYQGWSDDSPSEPVAHEPASDERVTNALHRVQDLLQQTRVLSHRRSKKTHTELAAERSRGNAAYAAMEAPTRAREWQEEATRLKDQKCQEAADVEAVYNETVQRTLEKTEALDKHVKTVTMRADSMATTEEDFSQANIERQEETQRDLSELSVQLGHTRVTQQDTRSAASVLRQSF